MSPASLFFAAVFTLSLASALDAQTPYVGGVLTENFNSLGATGTTLPAGWSVWNGPSGSDAFTWNNSTGVWSPATLVRSTAALTASNTPTANANNGYNAGAPGDSANRLLATAPTTTGGTALQWALANSTGSAIAGLRLGYDIRRFTAPATDNELPGYRLFLSLDQGASWTAVPALDPALSGNASVLVPNTVGVTTVAPATLNLPAYWQPGAELRLRWIDDNASQSSPDQILGLDNLSLEAVAAPPPPPAALTAVWSGAPTPDGATIVAMLDGPSQTRIAVSTDPTFANPLYSAPVSAASAQGFAVRATFTGLSPDTVYHYAVEIAGTLLTGANQTGRFRTLPVPGPASFRFAFASCGDWGVTADHFAYETVRTLEPDARFFLHMGDINYADTNVNDPAAYRQNYRNILTLVPQQGALFRALPIVYMWDDHDYSGNDSNRLSAGRAAHRQAYREFVPHYPLPAGPGDAPIQQSFQVGRVRFLVTDLRSERDPVGNPDNATKTIMGAAQKQWFKAQLLAARDAEAPLIVWNSSVPFLSTETSNDNWGSFQTERRELLEFIRDQQIKNLVIVSGDMHALAIDDGRGTAAYVSGVRIPVFHAAAIARAGSTKGGPYSHGVSAGTRRYGTLDIADTGGLLAVTYTGKIATSATAATTWQTFTLTTEPVAPRPALSLAVAPVAEGLRLAWTDDSTVETGYRVERSPDGAASWTTLATAPAGSTAYTDTTVAPGETWHYRVTTVNGALSAAPTAPASATFPALTGYAAWAQETLGDPAASPTADPDADGAENLLEYALATQPNSSASRPSLESQISNLRFEISFLRARPELTYNVEASSELFSWQTIATNPGEISLTTPVTVTDPVFLSDQPRRFLRLRVTAP